MRLNLYSSVLFCCCFPVLSILFVLACSVLTQLLRFLFFSVYFSACNFSWVSHPSVADSKVAPLFLKVCVCVLISVVCGIERGVAHPLFYLIVEYVRYLNLLNGRISLSAILNLIVLFQRRMCLLFSLRFYISFHLLFRAILSHALNCIECSRTVLFVWPFFNWLG